MKGRAQPGLISVHVFSSKHTQEIKNLYGRKLLARAVNSRSDKLMLINTKKQESSETKIALIKHLWFHLTLIFGAILLVSLIGLSAYARTTHFPERATMLVLGTTLLVAAAGVRRWRQVSKSDTAGDFAEDQ